MFFMEIELKLLSKYSISKSAVCIKPANHFTQEVILTFL